MPIHAALISETTLCESFLVLKRHIGALLQNQIGQSNPVQTVHTDFGNGHKQRKVVGAGWGGKELLA